MDHFFLLDNVQNYPHGSLVIPKSLKGNEGDWDVGNILGHFDDFTFNKFYSVQRIDLLPKDSLKFVIGFLHMPMINRPELTEEAVKLIRDDPNVYLLLISTFEYAIEATELHKHLTSYNIPSGKTIVLSSNIQSHNTSINGISFISINFWESYSRFHLKLLPNVSIVTPEQRLATLAQATKKFINVNRNIKHHRIWFYYSLIKNEMLDEGHVSYHLPKINRSEYDQLAQSDLVLKCIPQSLHDDYKMALRRTMYPRLLDKLDNQQIINYQDTLTPYYTDSLISFVGESDPRANFITEKTYKAIMNMHPFFIIGNPDQHTLLRARGYHTFEDLFGVDQIINYTTATAAITRLKNIKIENLKEIIRKRYMDKLVHNYNNFLHRKISWNSITNEILTTVNRIRGE